MRQAGDTRLIIVIRDEAAGESVDHQLPRSAILRAGDFEVSPLPHDLHV
jgi:hypothetical protein